MPGDPSALAFWAWHGRGAAPRVARAVLAAPAAAYSAIVCARGALYDRHVLRSSLLALPTVSVGNLTVGGTGKTPIAAWIAGELARRGVRPAVVLRGYGEDELLVHARLTPSAVVVADPDRVRGVARASALGAEVAVLDDAFQHRRARRDLDIVIVAADDWCPRWRLLPAGPAREPLSALRRADLVVLTRKHVTTAAALSLQERLVESSGGKSTAIAALVPGELADATDRGFGTRALRELDGRTVLAISAVGNPTAFAAQLRSEGAEVIERRFADHHTFDAAEAALLASLAERVDLAVCTLKDAVKLTRLWPRLGPGLWYVSQRVEFEAGEGTVRAALDRLATARDNDS